MRLLIVLNGIEMAERQLKTVQSQLLIVLNGIEIWQTRGRPTCRNHF